MFANEWGKLKTCQIMFQFCCSLKNGTKNGDKVEKKETERKKTLGAIWVRRCEQLLNVSHENVKRKKKSLHIFFHRRRIEAKAASSSSFLISKFRHYLPNSFACAASPFYPACIFFFTCSLYNKDVWQTLTWDLY